MSDDERDEQFEDAVDNLTENLHSQRILTQADDCTDEAPDDLISDTHDDNAETDSGAPSPTNGNAAESEVIIDEVVLRQQEACMTEEEKQSRRNEAQRLKELGNIQYNEGRYEIAIELYTDALAICLLCHASDRAILYANRAAARVKLDDKENAIADCTKALEYNPDHIKARLRRAELYEKTEKLDEALEDYTKALERDPSLHVARAACMRLPDQIKERNEKMKEEMLGKLKDLGNMILRPFGLSTENFKLQQDPTTGSYSVSFQQKPPSGV